MTIQPPLEAMGGRSLHTHDGSAVFHLDSLHLFLNRTSAEEFAAMAAAMPRDLDQAEEAIARGEANQALNLLISHCHEFVHYHQFAGSLFGLVHRRLIAARARVREWLLQRLGTDTVRAIVNDAGQAPLIQLIGIDELKVDERIKAAGAPELVELLGWFELFDAWLFEGDYAELFASTHRVRTLLNACDVMTSAGGVLDPITTLQALVQAPQGPVGPPASSLIAICEAQATLNEFDLHGYGDPQETDGKQKRWQAGRYWELPRRLGWVAGLTPETFSQVAAATLLVADIALNGPEPRFAWAARQTLFLHPTQAMEALLESYPTWRHMLNEPMAAWTPKSFQARRAGAVKAAKQIMPLNTYAIPGPGIRPRSREDHPMVQMLDLYGDLHQPIRRVRRSDPAAAVYPVAVVRMRPDSLLAPEDHFTPLSCPFLVIGGVPFRNVIDEESWVRWRLLCGYEIWLDNLFSGRPQTFDHVNGDAHLIEAIVGIAKTRILRIEG